MVDGALVVNIVNQVGGQFDVQNVEMNVEMNEEMNVMMNEKMKNVQMNVLMIQWKNNEMMNG